MAVRILCSWFAVTLALVPGKVAQHHTFAIVGGTVTARVTAAHPLTDAVVLVSRARITAVSRAAAVDASILAADNIVVWGGPYSVSFSLTPSVAGENAAVAAFFTGIRLSGSQSWPPECRWPDGWRPAGTAENRRIQRLTPDVRYPYNRLREKEAV
jgi:hypothetical protein